MASSVKYSNDGFNEKSPLLSSSESVPKNQKPSEGMSESSGTYKSRWRSIRVMYLTMFLSSVSFSICMSSLYPYLRILDPSADTDYLGWVVAAYSLGQLVASPFFGAWSNIRARSREPLIVSIVINALANILYMYLESIQSSPQVYLLLARALVGFGAGNVAVVRSYVAGATHLSERISAMANLSAYQSAGFIFGNLFQTAMVPLGYPGPVHTQELHFDMYSATGLFSALVGIINILLLVLIFKEHIIVIGEEHISPEKDKMEQDAEHKIQSYNSTDETKSTFTPDYIAVMSTIFLFFSVLFIFAVFETIITPFGMDMFAWKKTDATLYVGIVLGGAGFVAIVVFAVIKLLAKRFNERNLLFVGLIICIFGYVSYLPWGSNYPAIQYADIKQSVNKVNNQENLTTLLTRDQMNLPLAGSNALMKTLNSDGISNKSEITGFDTLYNLKGRNVSLLRRIIRSKANIVNLKSDISRTYSLDMIGEDRIEKTDLRVVKDNNFIGRQSNQSESENVGCPYDFTWCMYTPATSLWQYLLGTFFISVGYPSCSVISYTIFSKVLGPKPQGLWTGWLTAAGSLARTLGPVFVSQVYDAFGPRVAFTAMSGNIAITVIVLVIVYKRLVPFKMPSR